MSKEIYLPNELWIEIYEYNPLHREMYQKVLLELKQTSTQRLCNDANNLECETCFHANINNHYYDTCYWKNRGWCSVKCGSLNWPHACDFCVLCNADKTWCSCKKIRT